MPEPVPSSLAEALAALQGQLPRVAKDKPGQAGQGRYLYADLTDCTDAMMPLLSKLGLSFTSCPTIMEDGRFVLNYRLLHVSGDDIGGQYPLPTSGSPQQVGGAITYARRYTLCAVTGLAPGGDDDDAASAEAAHHADPTRRASAAGTSPGTAGSTASGANSPSRQPRNVPDAQLAAGGQMTRGQKAEHERLAADTVRSDRRAERSHPRGPDPDDPWAQDAPVDHERAAALRRDLEDRELPEDKPGTSSLEQQRLIAIELGVKGITAREDKLVYCATVTGREVASSKELSYNEAAAVLKAAGELEAVNA